MRYEHVLQRRLVSWEAELNSNGRIFSKELCLTNIAKIKQELESITKPAAKNGEE